MAINQPRVKGQTRTPVSAALLERIERRIEREQSLYGCSRSFVIATALAFAFDIHEQADYKETRKRKRQKRK